MVRIDNYIKALCRGDAATKQDATLPGKFSELNKKYGNTKAWDPAWDEMMSGLFIRTGERSIEARQRQ
jgi:hypothetical protein